MTNHAALIRALLLECKSQGLHPIGVGDNVFDTYETFWPLQGVVVVASIYVNSANPINSNYGLQIINYEQLQGIYLKDDDPVLDVVPAPGAVEGHEFLRSLLEGFKAASYRGFELGFEQNVVSNVVDIPRASGPVIDIRTQISEAHLLPPVVRVTDVLIPAERLGYILMPSRDLHAVLAHLSAEVKAEFPPELLATLEESTHKQMNKQVVQDRPLPGKAVILSGPAYGTPSALL
jgi:hypothetical protein